MTLLPSLFQGERVCYRWPSVAEPTVYLSPNNDTVGEFRSGHLDSDTQRKILLQTKVADRVLSILRLNRRFRQRYPIMC